MHSKKDYQIYTKTQTVGIYYVWIPVNKIFLLDVFTSSINLLWFFLCNSMNVGKFSFLNLLLYMLCADKITQYFTFFDMHVYLPVFFFFFCLFFCYYKQTLTSIRVFLPGLLGHSSENQEDLIQRFTNLKRNGRV